tara:strand:+ start:1084 stop:1503 length:420 start_codon:yes stop_codon:yes gene_type:complete
MTKVVFLSKEWIKKADDVLKELVSEFGEEGKTFSVSEALAEAPAEIAEEDGFVYYHILIDGKSARVNQGQLESADIKIQASYYSALKSAYIFYTPELIKEYSANPPKRDPDPYEQIEGDMSSSPDYITEFHNQMVAFTL